MSKDSLHKLNLSLRGRGYHLKWNAAGDRIIVMENNGAFAFYASNPIRAIDAINKREREEAKP